MGKLCNGINFRYCLWLLKNLLGTHELILKQEIKILLQISEVREISTVDFLLVPHYVAIMCSFGSQFSGA